MRRSGILNAELTKAISMLGHGDGLLVVDAGFPIPASSWRIDLAVRRDLPDLRTVLTLIAAETIVESMLVADEVETFNAPLHEWLVSTFPSVSLGTLPHADMLASGASRAKAVVRTGAFEPWGNVLLVSGVDVDAFFSREGVVVPDYYRDRITSDG